MASGSAYFLNSNVLHRMAKQAYGRTESASSDTACDQDDALVAVLFSAATLEAFISEVALYARMGSQQFPAASALLTLADALDEIETSRGSTRLKYLVAKMILSRQPYDKGSMPYQDFDLLFGIRDAIVHHKPERITKDPHKIVAALSARRLCDRPDPHKKSSWLQQASTRAVARWACNIVKPMVLSIGESCANDPNVLTGPFGPLALAVNAFQCVE